MQNCVTEKSDLLSHVQLKMRDEQRRIYYKIMPTADNEAGLEEIFFSDASKGIGKTFLIRTILTTIRFQKSSDIAY